MIAPHSAPTHRERGRATRRLALAWALACAMASSIWLVTAAGRLGATFDEPTYIAAGLDRWRHGGIGGLMRLGTMPLPVDVATLPVWLAERSRETPYRIASDGEGRVVDARDLHAVLPLARAGTLVFWWILLAGTWRLAVRLAGPLAGALAVTWVICEPSLLAHGTLATTDLALTALLLAFAASLPGGPPAGRSWIVPGVWFGLALVAKASALVFAPLIAVAFARPRRGASWVDETRQIGRMSAVALAITFLYCGSDWRTEDSFVAWARALSPGIAASTMVPLAEHLPIFSNAGEGIVQQIRHNIRGHDTYVLGRAYERAIWFYFPVVASIKMSGALLIGLLIWPMLNLRAAASGPLIAAAVILLASPLFRVQTGIRMILPVVALAIIGLAVTAVESMNRDEGRRQAIALGLVALLTTWSAFSAWRWWPDAIVHVNDFWGPARAPDLVSDSNYDWGQGLPALRATLTREDRTVDLWYWGTDPDALSPPFRLLDIRAVAPMDEATMTLWLAGRTLAVGATLLYGSVLSPDARVADADRPAMATAETLRRILRARTPARVGTFFVYEFD